jgi:hypothetical protein
MYGNNSFRQNISFITVLMHKRAIHSLSNIRVADGTITYEFIQKKSPIEDAKESHFRFLAERENEFHENRKLNDQYVTLRSIRILH